MLKIAICDDDEVFCHKLEAMIASSKKNYDGDVTTDVFFDGESIVEYMKQGNVCSLMFLDIMMQDMDGVSVAHQIRDVLRNDDVQIVFISSQVSYAMQLFALRPMNFLIKPITEKKLYPVMYQAWRLMEKNNDMYEYRCNRQSRCISIHKLQYFEVDNRKIIIHTQGDRIVYYGKMAEVIDKVKGYRFLRISRSELVNYDAIELYKKNKIRLYGGGWLEISKPRQKEVQKMMLEYSGEEL